MFSLFKLQTSPSKSVSPNCDTSVFSPAGIHLPRNERERGVYQRAVKQGVSLPCRISYRAIPMKTSAEHDTLQMVEWPFLLPDDFEPRFELVVYVVFLVLGPVKHHQTSPGKKYPQQLNGSTSQARSLIDDGHLNALVGDFPSLPEYWGSMKQDFPNHPVCMDRMGIIPWVHFIL